jgi:hypothetical protein
MTPVPEMFIIFPAVHAVSKPANYLNLIVLYTVMCAVGQCS